MLSECEGGETTRKALHIVCLLSVVGQVLRVLDDIAIM